MSCNLSCLCCAWAECGIVGGSFNVLRMSFMPVSPPYAGTCSISGAASPAASSSSCPGCLPGSRLLGAQEPHDRLRPLQVSSPVLSSTPLSAAASQGASPQALSGSQLLTAQTPCEGLRPLQMPSLVPASARLSAAQSQGASSQASSASVGRAGCMHSSGMCQGASINRQEPSCPPSAISHSHDAPATGCPAAAEVEQNAQESCRSASSMQASGSVRHSPMPSSEWDAELSQRTTSPVGAAGARLRSSGGSESVFACSAEHSPVAAPDWDAERMRSHAAEPGGRLSSHGESEGPASSRSSALGTAEASAQALPYVEAARSLLLEISGQHCDSKRPSSSEAHAQLAGGVVGAFESRSDSASASPHGMPGQEPCEPAAACSLTGELLQQVLHGSLSESYQLKLSLASQMSPSELQWGQTPSRMGSADYPADSRAPLSPRPSEPQSVSLHSRHEGSIAQSAANPQVHEPEACHVAGSFHSQPGAWAYDSSLSYSSAAAQLETCTESAEDRNASQQEQADVVSLDEAKEGATFGSGCGQDGSARDHEDETSQHEEFAGKSNAGSHDSGSAKDEASADENGLAAGQDACNSAEDGAVPDTKASAANLGALCGTREEDELSSRMRAFLARLAEQPKQALQDGGRLGQLSTFSVQAAHSPERKSEAGCVAQSIQVQP